MTEKQLASLRPCRTSEEAKIRGRQGGIKSGESRRKAKSMKETLEMILSLPVKDKDFLEQLKADGILNEDMNNNTALMYVAIQKAMQGDTQAMNFVRDTAGMKPSDKVEASVNQEISINVGWDD